MFDTITFRILTPDDAEHLRRLLEDLSDEDRRLRFLRPMPRIPESVIRALSSVDDGNHVAIGAFVGSECVGIARYVRYRDRPHAAEVAVTVAARHRRLGVATRLIARLEEIAPSQDVEELEIHVHPENGAARKLARRLGFTIRFEEGVLTGRRRLLDVTEAA